MRMLVVSDNHGLTEELKKIKERHQVDYLIHCGDSELYIDDALLEGFIKVSGNCDHDPRYSSEQDFQIGKIHLLLSHGHLYQVKSNLMPLSYRAQEVGAHIIFYGHTHIAHVEQIKNRILINPGSIYQSKSDLPESYVILDIDDPSADLENTNVTVRFYTVAGELVESHSFLMKI